MLTVVVTSIPTQAAILEEVTVTAQKRAQSLQDVGIAITAFTGEQMRALGVKDSFDFATFTPGIHISGNLAGQNTQFSIRGVTQNDFVDVIEAPNAVYLDEGYIAVAQGQTFALFDLERVEALKGPQGTLFGRNATGGLIHFISRKPSLDETDGYLDVTAGYYDTEADATSIKTEGAFGGPITEDIAARVAFYTNNHDGYLKNNYPFKAVGAASFGAGPGNSPGTGAGADLGDDDTWAVRGIMLFAPTENTEILASVNKARSNLATGPYQSKSTIGIFNVDPIAGGGQLINTIDTPAGETRESIIQGTALDGGSDRADSGVFAIVGPRTNFDTFTLAPGADFYGYIDPDGGDWTTSGDFAFEDNGFTNTFAVNLNIKHHISNNLLFTSITDYKQYDKLLFIDVDSAPLNDLANYAGLDADSLTQEFRLNAENDDNRWVLGFYYLHIDSDADNGLKAPPNSLTAAFGFGGLAVDIAVDAHLITDSYSIFGQYEWDFVDDFTLIGGLRIIQEEKDYEMQQALYASLSNFSVNQGTPFVVLNTLSTDSSNTLWAGKIQLDWRPNDDLLVYAGINRGVKAGSFNAPLAGTFFALPGGNADIPYDEEVLISYEGGFKASLFDDRARLNVAAFYYDYSDYQAFLFTGVGGVTINRDAENYGFEIDLQATPMEGLDVLVGMSWFDATVFDVPLKVGSTLSVDVDPTYAPELQAVGMVRYEWPALGGMMSIRGDASYSDEFFYNLRNFDADKFDSYVLFNSRLGWVSHDEKWDLSFSARNITDELAGVQGFNLTTLCGCNEVSYKPPRWFGLTAHYNF